MNLNYRLDAVDYLIFIDETEEEKEMKELERNVISVFNDYAEDYGVEGTLEELFPGVSIGELIYEMYEAGMIPEDLLEKFLEDDGE